MHPKMTRARADLIFDHPFFGAILLRLTMTKQTVEECPTMATNGYTIFYSEEFLEEITPAEIIGVLAHEVMHVILMHTTRLGVRIPKLWNSACDLVINPELITIGFKLPPTDLLDMKYKGATAEEVYEKLLQDPEVQKQLKTRTNIVIDGKSSKDRILAPPKDKKLNAEQDAKELTQLGTIAAKTAGKMPGNIINMILGELEPQVFWEDELRDFLTSSSKGEQSWARPNPRLLEQAYLPYTVPEPSAELALLIDASGSVQNNELEVYAAELKPIMVDNNITKLTVVYFNYNVTHVDVFTNPEDIKFNVKERGGTSFANAFNYLEENITNYDAILVFTDGEDYINFDPPEKPVLWCITQEKNRYTPPWGRVINLEF